MEGSGIINLLKPAGMTSHDCIDSMRKLTGIKRIGHSGTLDPMATGVLVVAIGRATRIIEYLENDDKEYLGEMILGLTTDTQDIWGTVLEKAGESTVFPENIEEIEKVFKGFEGDLLQEAPGYSAVRIQGKRLYEYARKGQEAPKLKRPVKIYSLDVVDYNREKRRVRFLLSCSKGTYVRTICHEAGQLLGTGGAMSFLLRTAGGVFKSSEAVSIEDLSQGYEKYLIPMDYPLGHFGRADLSKEQAEDFCNGKLLAGKGLKISRLPAANFAGDSVAGSTGDKEGKYCMYYGHEFLGVANKTKTDSIFRAEKVLCL